MRSISFSSMIRIESCPGMGLAPHRVVLAMLTLGGRPLRDSFWCG